MDLRLSLASLAKTVLSETQDGRLAARSLLSEPCKSKLSNAEKLLCDDSQLKFWLRLLEWKLVTTPLDELLLVHEFRRCTDGSVVDGNASPISLCSLSVQWGIIEMCCCEWCVCIALRSPSAFNWMYGMSDPMGKSFCEWFWAGKFLRNAKENIG